MTKTILAALTDPYSGDIISNIDIIVAENAHILELIVSNKNITIQMIIYIHYLTVSPHIPMATETAEGVVSQ